MTTTKRHKATFRYQIQVMTRRDSVFTMLRKYPGTEEAPSARVLLSWADEFVEALEQQYLTIRPTKINITVITRGPRNGK